MNIKIQDMNEKILSVAFLLAVLCLYSCNEEEKQEQMLVGNLVTLHVPVNGIDEGGAESAQTRGTAQNTAITVEEELEEGLTFECVLTPDVTAKTRAGVSASPVADNAKILMIAYWSNGNLYKYETFTPANPKIHLPEGENFKLIFYSYNSTEAPALDGIVSGGIQSGSFGGYFSPGAGLRDKDEDYDKNLMWTKIEDTGEISTSTILPGIIFTHLFSQVQWTAQSTAGPITACKASLFPTLLNATIRIGELKDLAPNDRNVWSGDPAGSWGRPLIDFSTSAGASATVTSGAPQTMSFIPNEGREISVELDHITVNGNVFAAKSINFNKKLSRGIRYLLTSNIKRKCTITFESEDNTKGYVTLNGEQSITQSVTSWGEQLSCTPRAAYHHKFDGWYSSKDGFRTKLSTTAGMYTIDDDGKLTVTVNKDTEGYTYQARFAFTQVRVQWVCVPEEGGSINQLYLMFDKGGSARSEVTNISFNYTFDGWYNDKDVKITSTSVSDTAYISNNGRRINLQNVMADAIYYAKFIKSSTLPITISAAPTVATLGRASGSYGSSVITTNDENGWTATIPASCNWLKLDKNSGMNRHNVNFSTLSENTTDVVRSVIITVASNSEPEKATQVMVNQLANHTSGEIIIATQPGTAPWGTAVGLIDKYNAVVSSPWVVYSFPDGENRLLPDAGEDTAVPWVGCKGYSELPDGSDRGTWRMPTQAEVYAMQSFYPGALWCTDNTGQGARHTASSIGGMITSRSRSLSYRCVRNK